MAGECLEEMYGVGGTEPKPLQLRPVHALSEGLAVLLAEVIHSSEDSQLLQGGKLVAWKNRKLNAITFDDRSTIIARRMGTGHYKPIQCNTGICRENVLHFLNRKST